MRKIVQKTSFLGGEAGFLLEGRSDLAQFQLGKDRGQNFITLKGGGDTRRPGTRYVKATQGNFSARLFPFVTSYDSGTDMYVLEIACASATSLTFRVIRVSDNAVYTPSGLGPLTVVTGVFSTDGTGLDEIQTAQSADILFITHKGFQPLILSRTSTAPAFTLASYSAHGAVISGSPGAVFPYLSTPYRTVNTTATTFSIDVETVGAPDASIVTASADFFNADHVGVFFRMKTSGGANGYFLVTTFTSTTSVKVQVVVAISAAASATLDWSEGSWSAYRGWPRTITFYGQRIVFGGNTAEPDTFWMSQVGDYFQMHALTAGISEALSFTLASTRLNQIRWMLGGKKLTIGTSSSEWVGTVTNDGTSLFVQFDEETNHGSAKIQPQKSAYSIAFAQRSGRALREMVFNFTSDAYEATDLTLFASHIGWPYGRFANSDGVRIVQMAYQESPFNCLWALDSFGRLYGLTRDKQQQIAAWHSHVVGGKMTELLLTGGSGDDYPAIIKSICVVPDSNGRLDRLWMVVQRAINGGSIYTIEYMDDIKTNPYLTAGSTGDLKAHLDCSSLATAASTVTWSGYAGATAGKPDLRNESVYVVAEDVNVNGVIVYAGLLTVSNSGVITLPTAATKLMVGLHADAYLRLLPIEGGDAPQINMRALKRIDLTAIRMHETWGLRIGKNRILRSTGNETNTTFEPIPFISTSLPTIETFTGIKEAPVPCDAETDGSFTLAMQDPWPCTILSVSSRVVSNEV